MLEIATKPCEDTREAGAELRGLRRQVAEIAAGRNLTIGSAGTHPFALWEDQRISARPRYRDLIAALRFVARQEVIFGLHVHVGIDDADKAIHVANGMRVHVPVLLALSANSPFWRGQATGLASDADADLPPVPARRDAALLRRLAGLRGAHRLHGATRRRSRTTPTSGTTSARTRTSARSRSARWTGRRGSSTRSRWRR